MVSALEVEDGWITLLSLPLLIIWMGKLKCRCD